MEFASDPEFKNDCIKDCKISWYIENKEQHKENCRSWQRAHPDKCKIYCDNWINKNREKYNEYHKIQQRIYDKKKREEKKMKKMTNAQLNNIS